MVNHPNRKLTPALRSMLEWIASTGDRGVMLLQITANGAGESRKLQRIRNEGWAEYCDIDLPRGPVDGVRITQAGRDALGAH